MLWLDSNDPADGNPATPGVARGLCPTTSGVPATVEAQSPNSQVIFSGIKTGPIGRYAQALLLALHFTCLLRSRLVFPTARLPLDLL